VTQVSAVREIQSHQSVMWSHQCLVDLQIGRAAAQALHVDPPPLRIQAERFECTGLTGQLDGIDVLIPSIVSSARIAFGVFIGHGRAQRIENGARGEILRGDQDDGFPLALDFLFLLDVISLISMVYHIDRCSSYHDLRNFRVCFHQGLLHDLHHLSVRAQTTDLFNCFDIRPGETWEERR
jgi:hypothetical protein